MISKENASFYFNQKNNARKIQRGLDILVKNTYLFYVQLLVTIFY